VCVCVCVCVCVRVCSIIVCKKFQQSANSVCIFRVSKLVDMLVLCGGLLLGDSI